MPQAGTNVGTLTLGGRAKFFSAPSTARIAHSPADVRLARIADSRKSQAHTNNSSDDTPATFSLVFRLPRKTLTQKELAKMSDGEVEVEAPQGYPVLPKDVSQEIGSTKLFNKWSYEDVEIRDISLT